VGRVSKGKGRGVKLPATPEAVEAELASLAVEIELAKKLYERRAALFVQARKLNPPMTLRQIARAAGITNSAVMQVLQREGAG